nr:hypothetical protein Itr_chr11CG06780 [Ipomoea trifida]
MDAACNSNEEQTKREIESGIIVTAVATRHAIAARVERIIKEALASTLLTISTQIRPHPRILHAVTHGGVDAGQRTIPGRREPVNGAPTHHLNAATLRHILYRHPVSDRDVDDRNCSSGAVKRPVLIDIITGRDVFGENSTVLVINLVFTNLESPQFSGSVLSRNGKLMLRRSPQEDGAQGGLLKVLEAVLGQNSASRKMAAKKSFVDNNIFWR